MRPRSASSASSSGSSSRLIVWLLIGAVTVQVLTDVTWGMVVLAILALTAVRMIPVALALAGSGLGRASVAFIGWFGPRGLASIVFGIIALDSLPAAEGDQVASIVVITVLASVVLHGITAGPLARRYGQRTTGLDEDRPEHQEQAGPSPSPRQIAERDRPAG